jgi:hypothetical protein
VGRDAILAKLEAVLSDPSHPAWLGALKFVTEQGYGKAPQAIEPLVEPEPPVKNVLYVLGQRIEF